MLSSYSFLFNFLLWLILLIIFSRLIDKFLSEIFLHGRYRWVIWIGIIVHEFSHAFMAKLMGAKITGISLFSKSGGSVRHTNPRVPIIGKPLVSMAPLFGCTLAIIGLVFLFGFESRLLIVNFGESFFQNLWLFIKNIGFVFTHNAASWRFWLFLYLVISIATTIAPSSTDFKNAIWWIFLIIIIIGVLFYFHIGILWIERVLNLLSSIFVLGVVFELLVIVLVFPFWLWRRHLIN